MVINPYLKIRVSSVQSISLSKDKGHYNHANKMIFDNKFIYFYFVNLT